LKNINKILIIVQRSNGDVFLSSSLIKILYSYYKSPEIDLLVNDDTLPVANLIPFVNKVFVFSYKKKQNNRWAQEINLITKLFKKYDLSINLTASDRSVLYGIISGKNSISAVDNNSHKSWWKKLFLSHYYVFDESKHILKNNLQPLNFLRIQIDNIVHPIEASNESYSSIIKKLEDINVNVNNFIIFHPSTQYEYKVYPLVLRNELLSYLSKLGLPIIVTGGKSSIDASIKKQLIYIQNVHDFIGETSFEEFIALSELSLGFIGMDTLNMHIAASQNKRIFAIFGPTNLKMWSPWSNEAGLSATLDMPIQTYGNVTIFQADMPCVACGKAGCNDDHGNSDCLDNIDPSFIYSEVAFWHSNKAFYNDKIIPLDTTVINGRKIILYIVYGDDQIYYDGAIFSFLTFKHWVEDNDPVEVVVLTEKPDKFSEYPITIIKMNNKQKDEWSLNGKYHFRIKNRGMAFVMDHLELKNNDKLLFLDTDTYFHSSPMKLFDIINPKQAVFYLNEGLIYNRKRFSIYIESLEGKQIKIDNETYELSINSEMWGSLMIGVMNNMRPSIDWADKLMVKFFDLVPAHTIEPFALSESLLKKYKIVEGKNFISLYSTSRKKKYARKTLSIFFQKSSLLTFNEKVYLAQKVRIKRPIFIILKQRFASILK
jgi:heptosyltransferase III